MANVHLTYVAQLSTSYHGENDWARYREMYEISRDSLRLNLMALDGHVVVEDTSPSRRYIDMFKAVMRRTYELWEEGHNVLCTDVDVICVQSTSVFDRFRDAHFRMFWPAQAARSENAIKLNVPVEFNAGVRYFPRTMPADLWEFAFDLLDQYEGDAWADDQAILNLMMYRQPDVRTRPGIFLHNDLNWSPYLRNVIPESDASIIHLHGSRSSTVALKVMQAYGARLGLVRL